MQVYVKNEFDMKDYGERIGRLLKGGECIELVGDVGAGKTTLTKGIANGLGITETVQSPTFSINRTYQARDGLRLHHYDFYRLNEAGIMAMELAESLSDPSIVSVIEWGDVVAPVLQNDRIVITITSPDEASRLLDVQADGKAAAAITERVL
jgi:tRNA threonylcarbamoyladenosine biosynthesis protein TsaE